MALVNAGKMTQMRAAVYQNKKQEKKLTKMCRTHPKWQQWLLEYDAYDEVNKALARDPFPDC